MKLSSIALLSFLATLPLCGEPPRVSTESLWVDAAHHAQQQLEQSQFAEAAATASQALEIAKPFGDSDTRLAATYHLLGRINRDWGHCSEARANFSHAIAVWRRQPDPDPHVFGTIISMISTVYECGDTQAARKMLHHYEPDLRRFSSNSYDDAKLLSLRASMYGASKDYARAEELFRQAIELQLKSPLSKPIDIALERGNLAVALDKQGRYAESLAETDRSIQAFEQVAPRHPALIAALNNAACTLADLGRRDDSERMFERALQMAGDIYGEDNHVTAAIMLSYASVLREAKLKPAAEQWKKKGDEAFRRALQRDAGTIDVEEFRAIGK